MHAKSKRLVLHFLHIPDISTRPATADVRLEASSKLFILRGLRIPTQSNLVST
jgi:hypothetical protein